jgi:uncharacterized repeat protein (TIGR03803 family)
LKVTEGKNNGSQLLSILNTTQRRSAGIILAIFCVMFLLGTGAAQRSQAQTTYTILHSFQGGSTDGSTPNAGVIVDKDGNLYGTTIGGGYGGGTIFKVDASGNESLLYRFPVSSEYLSSNGYNCVVFYAPKGALPYSPVVMGTDGNLYGTTAAGGANGYQCYSNAFGTDGDGAVFKLNLSSTPPSVSAPYSFTSEVDDYGSPGLAVGPKGNLYGINTIGNISTFGVFKLDTVGDSTPLYTFPSGSVGPISPLSKLMLDSSGNIYGTSTASSAYTNGMVYELVNSSGSYNTERVLHTFAGGAGGAFPSGGLIMDGNGNLYGLTSEGGGSSACTNGCGTVFELVNSSGNYTEKILYTFTGGSDGGDPTGELVLDAAGNLYGTAFSGGDTSLNNGSGAGVVFEVTPSGNETVLHAFGSFSGDGVESGEGYGGLAMGAAGNLYGTTNGYSDYGDGTVFKLTTPQLGTLAALNQVNAFFSQGAINRGQDNSLVVKLQNATAMINAGKINGAIGKLEGFINEVNALVNSGRLTGAQGSALTNVAESVIAQLM